MHTRQRSVVQFYSAPTVQFLSALDTRIRAKFSPLLRFFVLEMTGDPPSYSNSSIFYCYARLA